MIKKIVLGVALAGLIGVLVFGAVGRTDARLDTGTEEGHSAQGYGQPGDDGLNPDQQVGPRYGQAEGSAQGYGQRGDDGLNQDQEVGPRYGQAHDSPGSGPEDAPRYGQADGRGQGDPYGPGDGSGYGPEGRPGRGQREGRYAPAECDEDCDCDGAGPDHDPVDQRPLVE